MSRVSTYLNFPGNTWEAFQFYQTVFGGEFIGGGVARFGDFPPQGDAPMPEDLKNQIMHIELALLGGHVLMGSDAPPQMGFTVNFGNNAMIMLEPDTRAETEKLFHALSAGGEVTQKLEVMFWGALYGACTDKFGTRWMFNCTEK